MDQMGAEFFGRLYGISRFLANNSLAITSNWSKEMSVMQRESAFPDCADGLVLGNSSLFSARSGISAIPGCENPYFTVHPINVRPD